MEALDDIGSSKVDEQLSETFICPITQEFMSDPVVAADGYSYERKAIVQWMNRAEKGQTPLSPMTGKPLRDLKLKTNMTLKTAISHYKETLGKRIELELTEERLTEVIKLREERLRLVEEENERLQNSLKSTTQLLVKQRQREAQQAAAKNFTPEAASQLLHYTILGDTSRIREYLNCNKQLAHASGDITDKSFRLFRKITGFQYSIWAGHIEMQEVYLEHLTEQEAQNQFITLLKERRDILGEYGEPLNFFNVLLNSINYLRDNYEKLNEPQRIHYFNNKLRAAFQNMPAWFVHVFSEEGENKAWPMKDMTRHFSCDEEQLEEWFNAEKGAFVRGKNSERRISTWEIPPSEWTIGLIFAMVRLYKTYNRYCDKEDLFNHDRENIAALQSRCTKNFELLTARFSSAQKIPPTTPSSEFTQLMYFMVRGNVDNVRTLLNQKKEIVYELGEFCSIRGNLFPPMTAFQYAVWSGYEEGWELILNFLPESEAYKQLSALSEETPPLHFFDALIRGYDHYAYNLRKTCNEDECMAVWRNEVSPAQCNMPAWFVHIFWAYHNAPVVRDLTYLTRWYDRKDHQFAALGGGGVRMSDGSFDSKTPERFESDRQKCLALREECLKKVAALTERLERASKIELTRSPMGIRK